MCFVIDILKLKNLNKTFRNTGFKSSYVNAVSNVSLDIKQGETYGLVGESGCGKSTIGRLITRLIPASSGEIFYDNKNILSLSKSEFKPYRKEIQMLFQHPDTSLNPRMSVLDSLKEPFLIHNLCGKENAEDIIREHIKSFGIQPELFSRKTSQVSGGQIQRIVLARIMLLSPKLIILDEPTSMLDVSVQAQIMDLLKSVQKETNVSFLLISHDLDLVKKCSDSMGVMKNGVLLESGNTETLLNNPENDYTKKLIHCFDIMKT